MKLRLDEIVVGTRRREEMGDIGGLAESIKQHGLLHPVVVSEDKRLVAGGRRLEACKMLGWEEVPVTFLGELSENKLREIELEENLRREDLTEYEMSKNMVELAEIKAEELRSTFMPKLGEKAGEYLAHRAENSSRRGRPINPTSHEKLAGAMGIPRRTLSEAYQHVESVEKYPELEKYPKKDAIKLAKQLNELPPEEKPEDEEKRQQFIRAQRFKTGVDRLVDRLHLLSTHDVDHYFQGLDEIEWAFAKAPVFAGNSLSIIESAVVWLTDFKNEFRKRVIAEKGIRRVK